MIQVEIEKYIDDYPKPVTIEGTNKILNQLKNCICKIDIGKGSGFFCEIPYKNKKLKVLMTNNHVIDEKIIKENKKIKVSINDNKEYKIIELENKIIYTSQKYDITIIEINPEKEKIYNFLELDDEIFDDIIDLANKSVYILHYPNYSDGPKASISYGIIKNTQDEYNLIHYCCTDGGSSGSPIINLLNNKIIGIHKENVVGKKYNRGSLLKYPINEYLRKIIFISNTKMEMNNYFALLKFKEKIENKFDLNINSEQKDLISELEKFFIEKTKEKNKEWDLQIERAKWKAIVQAMGEMKCENGHDISDNKLYCSTCHGALYWVDPDERYAICKGCENNGLQQVPKKIKCWCGAESKCTVRWIAGYKI